MKLSRLFAAGGTFKEVKFNLGFNVILASVKSKHNKDVDTHGVGKSTLVEVIDFMMLKEITKDHFLRKNKRFANYSFFLEVLLNNGEYLVINRSVTADTKINFRLSQQALPAFTPIDDWTTSNVAIKKAKEMLNSYLAFDVATTFNYRKSITYFLRGQGDYQDVFQLQKFGAGNHRDWKPFIFELIGFSPVHVARKYDLENEVTELKKLVKDVSLKFNVSTSQIDKINGSIEIKLDEREELLAQLDKFSFHQADHKNILEAADAVETEIATLGIESYNLRYELDRIEKSLNTGSSFDINELETLYKEVGLYFPTELKKSYEELQQFNRDITSERNTYLKRQYGRVLEKFNAVEGQLTTLDNRRAELLSKIGATNSFGKYKAYQRSLSTVEAELAKLEEQKNQLDVVSGLNKQVEGLNNDLKEVRSLIEEQLIQGNRTYSSIRRTFHRFVYRVIHADARIALELNDAGNINFKPDIMNEEGDEATAKADGFSYKKLLCVCFDLAVILTYRLQSFFRFAYHDGVLEGLDNRKKRLFIELVQSLCADDGNQYLVSAIEDDLPGTQDGARLFSDKDVVLRLHDSSDEGKLFEFSF